MTQPPSPAFDTTLAASIEKTGMIAVLVIDDAQDAVPLAQALLTGGVNVIELTLRTPVALDALKKIKKTIPEMVVGVGTILTEDQVTDAVQAGAAFGVSPGCNPRVLQAARKAGLSFAPGIATPTDIEIAVENGCHLLKFFPAEAAGGLSYLKAMAAPYAHLGLKYIPLGGLTSQNMAPYLTDPLIAALGGSWLAPRELIRSQKWETIQSLATEATQKIKSLRS